MYAHFLISARIEWDGESGFSICHLYSDTVFDHRASGSDLFAPHPVHPPIPTSKQYLHLERVSDDSSQLLAVATGFGLAPDRLPVDTHPREMPVAFHSTGHLGYRHSVQSGARFVSSMLLHCLCAQEILSDEKMDGCVFRRTMDCHDRHVHSGFAASKIRRILLPSKALNLILCIPF